MKTNKADAVKAGQGLAAARMLTLDQASELAGLTSNALRGRTYRKSGPPCVRERPDDSKRDFGAFFFPEAAFRKWLKTARPPRRTGPSPGPGPAANPLLQIQDLLARRADQISTLTAEVTRLKNKLSAIKKMTE